jgi:hypothetical protein
MSFLKAQRQVTALALVIATTACGTIRVDLPARMPTQIGTRTQVVIDRFGVCWFGEVVSGAIAEPVNPPSTGQMVAGYDNHVRRGQSCHTQVSHAYTAVFRFDLSDISRSVITNAYLHLDRTNTNLPIRVTSRRPYGTVIENSCALDLEMATEDVSFGAGAGSISSMAIPDSDIQIYNDAGGVGSGGTVTWAVQEWALGNRPNLGFVIRAKPGTLDKNDDSCTGYWFNPRLTITVLRPAP